MWTTTKISPSGSNYTSLVPTETLSLAFDGTVSSELPNSIIFVDDAGIRPVCPFFELHAQWSTPDGSRLQGPVTAELLRQFNTSLKNLTWVIEISNLKAFHYTYNRGDHIDARIEIHGDDSRRIELLGVSPADVPEPLVPEGKSISMGAVQLAKLDNEFPEIRLRFYAPKGRVYGPTNLHQRIDNLVQGERYQGNTEWKGFRLSEEHLILNANSSWANYVSLTSTLGPFRNDYRNTPAFLLASVDETDSTNSTIVSRSLGLIDDVGDGVITCRLMIGEELFEAKARIVIGPPDFAPTNRTVVSLADNLSDRENRDSVRQLESWTPEELGELVMDIFERAFESSDLMHKDYQNWRSHRVNNGEYQTLRMTSMLDIDEIKALLWEIPSSKNVAVGKAASLALSEAGTRQHRRHATLEYLEDRFRENPLLFDKLIRRPLDPMPYYDKRMPALMRGSDGRPFHLTRRQWEIFRMWIDRLQINSSVETANE